MASPLTKYMLIAVVVLLVSLGGALWLSFKFYGDREVAKAVTEQLATVVEEEKTQTDKAVKSAELADKAIVNVQRGELKIEEASQKLQEEVSKVTPNNPTSEITNETKEPCGAFLGPADIRLLQQSHCLTDGDPSDCGL